MGTQLLGQRCKNAIVISPETNSNPNQQEFKAPISRKHMNSEEPPSNPSKRPNCLFFKTRLCTKFRSGSCANGPNCNYAHSCEELRRHPANRQESVAMDGSVSVEQMLANNKICRNFYRSGVCSYGERCAFMHLEPGMLRENANVSKGSAVGLEPGDESFVVVGSVSGKPMSWKTRMCNKWEVMGYCPFGEKCHFAHGHAELMEFKNYFELERANIAAALLKPHLQHIKVVSPGTAAPGAIHHAKGFLKWKGQKVSHIYADWIDENPLRACSTHPKAGI